jgi:TonB family protein
MTIAIGLFFGPYLQSPAFENQAIARVRQLNVRQLDSGLRERPFDSWLREAVGPRAGISWQLTDCGVEAAGPGSEAEVQACVEISALLPDDRKVVVLTWVGSFKRGLYGEPKIQFAIVESKGEIFEAARLGDLPQMLRNPHLISLERSYFESTPPPPLVLPVITSFENCLPTEARPIPSRALLGKSAAIVTEDEPLRVSEGVLLGSVSRKVLPDYPQFARERRVWGSVKVEVTIDVGGRVISARAISGPSQLRLSAEDAARKWVFNPTTLNKLPVSVRGFLTFIFTRP